MPCQFVSISFDDYHLGSPFKETAVISTYSSNMVVGDQGIHRWTVDEYERAATLLDLDRVELIDGVVFDVSPESFVHSSAVMVVRDRLKDIYSPKLVMAAGSVRLDDGSLWNPDVYVLDAPPDKESRYPQSSDVLLAVEVSLSTWQRDTERKLPVYARNGIPEVWLLRPADGKAWELVRFTDPDAEAYRSMTTIPLPDGPGTIPA
jgi:Uma2 family endonuclease